MIVDKYLATYREIYDNIINIPRHIVVRIFLCEYAGRVGDSERHLVYGRLVGDLLHDALCLQRPHNNQHSHTEYVAWSVNIDPTETVVPCQTTTTTSLDHVTQGLGVSCCTTLGMTQAET